MIVSRSPFRISLGGGGTDLPSYYREHEGFLIAAAIDKYVYLNITTPFEESINLKYSSIETVSKISEIKHPIIKEALKFFNTNDSPKIEITSISDIPGGTGLGSSGSFTTALINALSHYYKKPLSKNEIANLACDIEINKLNEPIGKQDQYIAAFGGLSCFTFHRDDTVTIEPLKISEDVLYDLEDNLLLFFTGFSRSASSILKDQNIKTKESDNSMIDNLHYVKEMGYRSKKFLEEGDLLSFGSLMHEHWEHKKRRSGGMSNDKINEWYTLGINNGAIGGKLVGAGGGGFLLFYTMNKNKLRQAMKSVGLQEVRFKYDFEGTKLLFI